MQVKLSHLVAVTLLLACGSGQSDSKPGQTGIGTKYDPSFTPGVSDSELAKEEVDDGSKPFDEEAGKIALERGGRKVKECPGTAGTPPGDGEVQVIFDGDAGKVVDVELPSWWSDADPQAQSCIKNAFIGEFVPPFDGGKKSVPYSISIPAEGAGEGDKK